jgi:hypothetical protein
MEARRSGEKKSFGDKEDIFDELSGGKNKRRFLPRVNAETGALEETFFLGPVHIHFEQGPDKKTVRCLTRNFDERGRPLPGTTCPICLRYIRENEINNRKYARGSADGKAAWSKLRELYVPKERYFTNVIVLKDGSEEQPIKILSFGTQIWEKLMRNFFDPEVCGDFTDPDNGRVMIIDRTGVKRDTRYEVRLTNIGFPIADAWAEVVAGLHDLEQAAGKLRTPQEIEDILNGVSSEEVAEEAVEEVEEAPAPVLRRPAAPAAYAPAAAPPKMRTRAPVEEKFEEPPPGCYGSPAEHDPADPTCKACDFREACAAEPEVAAKLARSKPAAPLSAKGKLALKAR